MTLERTSVVDFTGIERETGVFVLTLTDAWGWSSAEEHQHLHLLQEKLNAYIAAIETGEIYAEVSKVSAVAIHPRVPTRISVRALYEPSETAKRFYEHVESVVRSYGVDFEVVVGRPKLPTG